MSDDEARRREALAAITADVCRALDAASDEALTAAVAAANAYVGIGHGEAGTTSTYVRLSEHFADLPTLRQGLRKNALEARSAAVTLLAAIDPPALLPHWRAMLPLQKRGFYAMSWAGAVAQAASQAWYAMVELLPPDELGEMFLRGETSLRGVPDEALARLSLDRVVDAVAKAAVAGIDHDDARRLATHPGVASVEAQAAVLTKLLALPKTAIARYAWIDDLLRRLGASGDERAVPALLVASTDEDARYRAGADAALIALRHAPSLERIGRGVAEAAARGDLKWDPFHVARDLQRPIQAVFAVDPATAVDRFAPYLTPEAVEKESNAKLVCDILAIGRGVLVSHQGVRIGSGNETWLDADPRWREVCAGLAKHKRLGAIVAPLLKGWGGAKGAKGGKAVRKKPAKG